MRHIETLKPRTKTARPAPAKTKPCVRHGQLGAADAADAGAAVGAVVDTAWFKRTLADKHLSQRQLAFRMGMDPGAMSLMLNGKRGMSAGEAAEMARWIGVPVEEVLKRAGVDVPGRSAIGDKSEPFSVPVVGWVDGTTQQAVQMGSTGLLGPKDVPRPNGVAADVVGLRVQGGLMDGWVVYYRPTNARAGLAFEIVGQLCVVGLSDGRVLLRHVRMGYGEGELILVGMCGEALDAGVGVAWATPVLWIKQR